MPHPRSINRTKNMPRKTKVTIRPKVNVTTRSKVKVKTRPRIFVTTKKK